MSRKVSGNQSGFTLLEAMISIVILGVGILSLGAVYAQGIFYANLAQYDYIAEKKAEEAVETIFTARDTGLRSWSQIENTDVGAPNPGVFTIGPQPMCDPGADGLVGTADDNCALPDTVITGPGTSIVLNNFMSREIAITVPDATQPAVRLITVTIRYTVGTRQRTYTLVSYISSFA